MALYEATMQNLLSKDRFMLSFGEIGKINMTKSKFFGERENEVICTPLFEAKHLFKIFACLWIQNSVLVCLLLAFWGQVDCELIKCQSLNKIIQSQSEKIKPSFL